MLRLWGYSRRYLNRYLLGGACLVLTASLAMSVPYLLKRAIDAIEAGRAFSDVALMAALIAAIAVVQGFVRTLSRALIFNVGRDIEFDLRNDLFAHLERLPLSYYHEQQTGDLMSRLINDVTAIRMLLGVGFLNLLNTPLYYAYGLSIMLTLNAPLTVAALIPFPLLLFAVKRVSRRMMEQTLRVQQELSNLSSAVQENVAGIHVVRAYQAEDVAVERFARSNDALTEESLSLARVRGQLAPIMRSASGLGTLVVLCFGGAQVARGVMSLGDLVAFIGYLNLLAWPTMAMGWMLSVVQRGRAAMQRLEQIFAVEPAIVDAPDARPLPEVAGSVEYRNVGFAYGDGDDSRRVIEDVSFKLEPGQKLAIVGRTGAGKSTLVHLLPRLFDVSEGEILLDGRDVRRLPLRQLRDSIGFVPQDPFLFSTRIEDNIAFALDAPHDAPQDAQHDVQPRAAGDARDARDDHRIDAHDRHDAHGAAPADEGAPSRRDRAVRAAAEAAGVASDIEGFPRGYQTMIGERGVTLSGGQKQRLTLARALASEPRILVLDDALSSVDTRTEQAILSSLRDRLEGKSSIFIAHRLSTVMDADLILVLDDGRVVERGDHAALLERDGYYARLFREQQLEEALETT